MTYFPGIILSISGIPSNTGVKHWTVPAPSTAISGENAPAPIAAATWSWLIAII